ncbi:MAG: hypothetical protein HKN26_02555 [Acidimicrobiales bacterium]|nr:hypothetical protein [Acidimicrobiales bacterium]
MGLLLRIVVWVLLAGVFLLAFASLVFVTSATAARLAQRLRADRPDPTDPGARFDNDEPIA